MNASAIGSTTIRGNCEPTASASDNPSSTIRRQFHKITSRGAYNVCATAMAVKMAPKAPQAAPISGSADQMARGTYDSRRETVKSQCNVSAGISEKPAGDVPERRPEQETENNIGGSSQAMNFADIFGLEWHSTQHQRS